MRRAACGLLLAIALGALFGLHRIADPDIHQQVAVGRAILAEPSSLGISSFTHTFPGFRYVEDKWLASVIVALVDRAGGTDGLMVYQIALAALVAGAWFAMLRVWGAAPSGALAGVALLLVANAYRLEPRPDTLSHALLAAFLGILGSRLTFRGAAVVLVALLVVWANLHGYFVNGLLAILAALAAAAAGDPRGPLAARAGTAAPRRGAWLVAAALASCAVHPQGLAAAVWPVRQILELRAEPALRSALTEFVPSLDLLVGLGIGRTLLLVAAPALGVAFAWWRGGSDARLRVAAGAGLAAAWIAFPPSAGAAWPYRITFAWWIAAAVEAPRAVRDRRLFPVLLFAGLSVLAAPMIRNLSLIPPAAAVLVAPAWTEALRGWRTTRPRLATGVAGLLLVACVAGAAWGRLADHLAPGTYRAPGWTGWGLARDRFPVAAADLVARAGWRGELLNGYDTSGFLLHRLHPARAAFIVDNTSMYPASFLGEYRTRIMAGAVDPEELFARWGVTVAVLDHAAMETPGLVARLSRSASWRLVSLDRAAALWVRDDERTLGGAMPPRLDLDAVLDRLGGEALDRSPLPRWLAPRDRQFPALNLGIFLRAAGRPDLALREADRLWSAAPSIEIATFSAAASEEAGALAEAVPRLERARALFGGTEASDRWLARALFVRGVTRGDRADGAEAREDLERSLDLVPDERGPALALARLAARGGDPDRARRWLDRALGPGGDPRLREAALADPDLAPLILGETRSVP